MIEPIKSVYDNQPMLFAAGAAGLTLGAAFGFQLYGYPPCDLCWTQRYPYMAIIIIGILGHVLKLKPTLILSFLTLLFAVDAGVAGYHAGVEYKWWPGPDTCTGVGALASGNVEDALSAIMSAPLVRCDEVPWSLAGISMAGYNFLIATTMTILTGFATQKSLKG
ncbi:disulfide bond formation protein B [Kordiimonas sp. SCSIO 12610]|uniref:disulfide bond formation protein B n=1 Tax=Kordiimonas sp. SCSIO 12610 TaxID=2829597 RepID=UPI00210EB1C2|nr:disulfide bond formation protein B [Kordiimonas sp. SCSIO 12610]UTW55130.1 disulfide bond formation protein B [Kordiimonas sp. SCSIO 12610]